MQKIGRGIFLIAASILISIILSVNLTAIFSSEVKVFSFQNKSHILTSRLEFDDKEKEFLEKNLSNNHLLILFADKEKGINENNINDILSSYRQNINFPYVLFTYDIDNRTLSSVSGGEVLFEDILEENVDYTEIYKYIPHISSNMYENAAIQIIIPLVFIDLFCALLICFIVLAINELCALCKWNSFNGIKYKPTIFANKLKIKIDKKNRIIDKIVYKGNTIENKGYFIMPIKATEKKDHIIEATYKDNCKKIFEYSNLYGTIYSTYLGEFEVKEVKDRLSYIIKG